MLLTQQLLANSQEIWNHYLTHPFVIGLADGSLDLNKFRYYMIQDYLYLKEYIKVFAQGLCHASAEYDLRLFAESCQNVVAEIDRVHKPYMNRIGITEIEVEEAQPHISNLSYTSYMIQAATFGNELDALVAILSCAWSYAWIAAKMQEKYPTSIQHKFYGEWFEGYISKEYVDSVESLTKRIDALGKTLSENRRKQLSQLFYNCSLYEKEFWDMAWQYNKS